MRSKNPNGSINSPVATGIDGKPFETANAVDGGMPCRLREIMDQGMSHSSKLTVGGGKLTVEMPVRPPQANFQTVVNTDLRTQAEVDAGLNSPFAMPPRDPGPSLKRFMSGQPPTDEPAFVRQDEDVELNAFHRFRLEPDDGQPVEFIGCLIARALVDRGDTQRTWVGLYKTRGGKIISEIVRDDGRARNVVADLGDRFRSVKVFDSLEAALESIRSAALRNQLLSDLGMLQTKFID
jgi:hypothetical protein